MKNIFLLLLLLTSCLAQAKIDVAFVPSQIQQGEAVELVLSSETPFQNLPNLDVLENDFVIGGQQRTQGKSRVRIL